MHDSVLNFLRENVGSGEIAGKDVIELASQNINGTPRIVIQPMHPKSYCGIDIVAGPGVDRVGRIEEIFTLEEMETFDVVISCEGMEHFERWRECVNVMKRLLKPGGLLLVTTRSPGFGLHNEPDHWRYTLEDFRQIFSDMEILKLESDPQTPGVFLKARRPVYPKNLEGIEVAKVT